jgi:hypothetical protein
MITSILEGFNTTDRTFRADPVEPGLATGAFAGHRWFAADLTEWLRPRLIVELGSELGCSFSAFGEGLSRLPSDQRGSIKCVDLWSGFEEYGFISSDDSYRRFQVVADQYPEIQALVERMSFDDAAKSHGGEIDLLLIDGVHTYDACRHDFLTWQLFLSSRAVVLFHDTAAGHGNGSSEYWSEVKQSFPHLEFSHSYGLGVLFVGSEFSNLPPTVTTPSRLDWYEFRWRSAIAERQVRDLEQMISDRDAAIVAQAVMIDDRDAAIVAQAVMIDDRDAAIAAQAVMIDDRDAAIAAQAVMIDDRDAAIAELSARIRVT